MSAAPPPKRLPGLHSLQTRVLLATLAGVALALALSGWGLQHLFAQHAQRQFQAALSVHLHQLLARLNFAADGQPILDPAALTDPRWSQPFSGLYWQISRPDGRVILRSRSLWDQVLDLPPDIPGHGEVHLYERRGPSGQPLLVLEQSVRSGESPAASPSHWVVAVAASTVPMEEAVRDFGSTLWTTLALLLALLAAAAVAQVWVALAPLRALQRSLEQLNAGHTARLQGRWPSEVQPLADGFNQALDRLEHHLQTARTQAGNLAHALKTPLAVLRQAAEQQLHAPAPSSTLPSSLASLVLEHIEQAQRQIDRHLRRARSAALAGHRFATPLLPALQGLLRVMAKVHAERALSLHAPQLRAPSPELLALRVAVEEQDLHDMLGNLLDNACRWARQRVHIHIEPQPASASGAGHVRVHIADDGPGIAPQDLERVRQRGQRLDEQTPGSGLGLAIVGELAELHGCQLQLHHRDDPTAPAAAELRVGGLIATLSLPRA